MNTRCCVFTLLFITYFGHAQDTLVYKSDIAFSSAFEKTTFEGHFNGTGTDLFNLFMANGALLTEKQIEEKHQLFYAFLASLRDDKFETKKPDRKVKILTNAIQNRYLLKYVAESRFEDVFYNGNFAELSGTALYCLAFEYFKIPYQIKEEAANIYVVAYPQTEKIMIESTVGAVVVTSFDGEFQRQFLETLRNQKIISEQEYARTSADALFETYYFDTKSTLTIVDLAAMSYVNMGLNYAQREDFEAAHTQFEKAYFLGQSPKSAYLLMEVGKQAFIRRAQHDMKQASLLGKVSRYQAAGVTDDMIAGEFDKAMRDLLFDKRERATLESYYTELMSKTTNLKTRREVDFVYSYENGRYLYNQARYQEALPYFETALAKKPTNQDAATILISTLGQIGTSSMENEDYSKRLLNYAQQFPTLSENNLFNGLVASSLLVQQSIKFEGSKPVEGDAYRVKFEEIYRAHPDISINSYLLGRAYSAAAAYYFRKGQTKRAKEYIALGLKISPTNYELRSREQVIR